MKRFLLMIGLLFLLTSLQAQSGKLRGEWVLEKVEEVHKNDAGKAVYKVVTLDYLASMFPKGKVSKFRYKFGGAGEKSYAYRSTQGAMMGGTDEIKYGASESVLEINKNGGVNTYDYQHFRLKSDPEKQYLSLTGKESGVPYRFTYSRIKSSEDRALEQAKADLERAYGELDGTWVLVNVERSDVSSHSKPQYKDFHKSGDLRSRAKGESQVLTFLFDKDKNRRRYYRSRKKDIRANEKGTVYRIDVKSSVKHLSLGETEDKSYTYELFRRNYKQYMYLMKLKNEYMPGDTSGATWKPYRFTYEKKEE